MESIFIALGTTGAFLLTVGRAVGWKNVAKHSVKIDVGGTALVFALYSGTSTMGIVASVWTGLFLAIFTTLFKKYWKWAAERGHLSPLDADTVDWQKAKSYAKDALVKVEEMLA